MSFRGVTFNKQTCKSEDDALIFHTFLNAAVGRIRGCKITWDTENIYISTGYFMTYGRLVNIYGAETQTPEGIAIGTQYNRLVFTVDLSQENSATIFNQGYFEFLSSYDEYPELTQEDLFDGGYVYQIPFCKFELTPDGIQNFAEELGTVNISDVWTEIEKSLSDYRSQFDDYFESYKSDFKEWFAAEEQVILQMIKDLQDQDFVTNAEYEESLDNLREEIFNGFISVTLLSSDDEPLQDRDYNDLLATRYIQFK